MPRTADVVHDVLTGAIFFFFAPLDVARDARRARFTFDAHDRLLSRLRRHLPRHAPVLRSERHV